MEAGENLARMLGTDNRSDEQPTGDVQPTGDEQQPNRAVQILRETRLLVTAAATLVGTVGGVIAIIVNH